MSNFAVLGAGLQGLAVSADLAARGGAEHVLLADVDGEAAASAAERANAIAGRRVCRGMRADASAPADVAACLEGADVAVSCLPYWMHPALVPTALAAGVSLIDVGGDTEEALETLARDAEARAAGVVVVTDAGLAPGLVNALAAMGIEAVERPRSARLYCGGLPRHPRPPLRYHAVFSLAGLLSEYSDVSFAARNGQVVRLDPMTELETIVWEGLGPMEAFVTSGGSGTAPWAFAERLERYEYKTLRFPGHCERVRSVIDGRSREDAEAALARELEGPPDTDQVLLRVVVEGEDVRWTAEARDFHDPATGLSAMQRMTAFPTAILAAEVARGAIPPGCRSFEAAASGALLVEGLSCRGIEVSIHTERWP